MNSLTTQMQEKHKLLQKENIIETGFIGATGL